MPRGTLADALHRVDPKLKIVEARPWPGKRRTRLRRNDWEKAAGINCNGCHKEVFRSRDGLCMDCWNNKNEFEIRDKTGILEAFPKEVIMAIVRPAKKES